MPENYSQGSIDELLRSLKLLHDTEMQAEIGLFFAYPSIYAEYVKKRSKLMDELHMLLKAKGIEPRKV